MKVQAASRSYSSVDIVVPCYNEEAGIATFHRALKSELELLDTTYRVIFVDDGSRDSTLALLHKIEEEDPHTTVFSLSRNFGHQIALTAGLDQAEGDVVITMDSDLQHPPTIIHKMLTHYVGGADIVYGVRKQVKDIGLFKRMASNGYYALLSQMTDVQVIRGAADFRLTSQEVVLALRRLREQHRYLRGMVCWLGFDSAIVYYDQPQRIAGQPAYTWRKSIRLARHGLFSFSTIPLDLITYLGVGVTALGFFYLVWVLFVWIQGIAVSGWTSVVVVLLLMGGVQLISIGVLAQYIGMIFEQSKQRPLYLLREGQPKIVRHLKERSL